MLQKHNFLKNIRQAFPLHIVIAQVCKGEKLGVVRAPLMLLFFHSYK